MQREAADEHVNRREFSKDAHGRRIDADFFGRFTQRRVGECFPGICGAARQADLSRMPREAARADRQCDRGAFLMGIHQQQRGGLSRVGRDLTGSPRGFQHFRRESDLRLDPRQRFA